MRFHLNISSWIGAALVQCLLAFQALAQPLAQPSLDMPMARPAPMAQDSKVTTPVDPKPKANTKVLAQEKSRPAAQGTGALQPAIISPPKVEEIPAPTKVTRDFYNTFLTENFELAQILLQQGADINCRNCGGATLLSLSFMKDTFDSHAPKRLDWLLAHGANPNSRDANGFTPLVYYAAFITDQWNISHISQDLIVYTFASLLDAGADVNAADDRGYTALHYLATSIKQLDNTQAQLIQRYKFLIDLMLSRGGNINARSKQDDLTPLMLGIRPSMGGYRECNRALVEHMIVRGADVDAKSSNGQTAYDTALEIAVGGKRECNQLLPLLKPRT